MSNINSERFIFNSDLLQFAQAGVNSVTITRPAFTNNPSTLNNQGDIVVNLPSVKGALPFYTLEYNTTCIFIVDGVEKQKRATLQVPLGQVGAASITDDDYRLTYLFIGRKDSQNLLIHWHVPDLSDGDMVDAVTFTLKVQYIYPPNVV